MAFHNDLGREGEEVAKKHLIKNGYKLLNSNYRFKHLEIDLIMKDDQFLIIVEVKTRTNNQLVSPESALTRKKQKQLIRAANQFIIENNIDLEVRFDLVTVVGSSRKWNINHLKDAFYPTL